MVYKSCSRCGKQIAYAGAADLARRSKTGFCRQCYLKKELQGAKHPRWKGGVVIHKLGYRLIRKPAHPFAKGNGYVFEHRLVVEASIGRYLKSDEIIHHLNGIKSDNRLENLVITNSKEHAHKYDAHHPNKGRVCSIEGCNNKHASNSFCKDHVWEYYLKKHRKISGYNTRAAIRAREYRKK